MESEQKAVSIATVQSTSMQKENRWGIEFRLSMGCDSNFHPQFSHMKVAPMFIILL